MADAPDAAVDVEALSSQLEMLADHLEHNATTDDGLHGYSTSAADMADATNCRNAATALRTLSAQLAQAREDARRYRWLRDSKAYVAVQHHYQHLPLSERTGWTIRLVCGNDDSFDAAIDAARATPKDGS